MTQIVGPELSERVSQLSNKLISQNLLVDVLDLEDCLGYYLPIESNKGQDQARDMARIVGNASRTINSPPAG